MTPEDANKTPMHQRQWAVRRPEQPLNFVSNPPGYVHNGKPHVYGCQCALCHIQKLLDARGDAAD